MHARHTRNKLRASENHASAAKDVVDEVEHHKDSVSVWAISDANELERCMRIRNAKLGHDAQDSH